MLRTAALSTPRHAKVGTCDSCAIYSHLLSCWRDIWGQCSSSSRLAQGAARRSFLNIPFIYTEQLTNRPVQTQRSDYHKVQKYMKWTQNSSHSAAAAAQAPLTQTEIDIFTVYISILFPDNIDNIGGLWRTRMVVSDI